MSLESVMYQHQKELSSMDWEILRYILENEKEVMNLNIIALDNKVHTSKSSILRLTKKLGFTGYSEFKYFLRQVHQTKDKEAEPDLLTLQMKDIENTIKLAQQINFDAVSRTIQQANTIYCYATGYSQRKVVEEFSKMLMLCDKRSIVIPVKTELDTSMSMIRPDDVVVFVSLSGETESVKENIRLLNIRKIPIISLTKFSHNFFAEHAQFAYFYYSSAFSIRGKQHAAQSLVGLSVLVDLLFREYVIYVNENVRRSKYGWFFNKCE